MRILFTGGGTAGHVTPNLSLVEACRERGWEALYAGSAQGIERELIAPFGIPYYAVASGKLRRYLALANFLDPLRVLAGVWQSFWLCGRLKPDAVFSKGGFVAVPVVAGAWLRGVPVVIHESDMTPGLANRLCAPFARRVCVAFEPALHHFPGALLTGTPLRRDLLEADPSRGLRRLGFEAGRPVLLVVGGSLGALRINQALRQALPDLLRDFQIAHLCGAGHLDPSLDATPGYRQFEYLREGYGDVLSCADLVVSRAGANALSELLAARKPNLLIPLPAAASRGDQIDNARHFATLGYSRVLLQEQLTAARLTRAVHRLWATRQRYAARMARVPPQAAAGAILDVLAALVRPGAS
jgi:UDP-N-acetylglucosamine--N-acetylmuramyl-(pentapeptide) pyrophosphoryl-undecaprenol N-acetylglucosamine transferase